MSKYKPTAGEAAGVPVDPNFVPSDSDNFGFFPSQVIDNLMHVAIALGAEQWTLRRRILVLERVLEQSGVLDVGAVEQFVPGPPDNAIWEAERDVFIKRTYAALARVGRGKPIFDLEDSGRIMSC